MNTLDKIYDYLLSDNILLYENELFEIIPELKYEKNFEQRSEWHCFDVWGHTTATISACDNNVEDRLVMLLHDIGKPFSYQDDGNIRHFKGHAQKSAEMAKKILDRLNIPEKNKNTMIKLIDMHSTKINIESIDAENLDFYKRLLKIKIYDAKGYEEEHSKIINEELDKLQKILK